MMHACARSYNTIYINADEERHKHSEKMRRGDRGGGGGKKKDTNNTTLSYVWGNGKHCVLLAWRALCATRCEREGER